MLNMRSDTPTSDDRTTAARIRDAAIACFAEAGVAATSVRTIAATAGVSPALVMHHFGSKDRLREACDRHVAALIRESKEKAVAEGGGVDPVGQLRAYEEGLPLLRYLARTLPDGSPQVAEMVDQMVADAVEYIEQAVETGLMRPSDDPYGRAAVLTLWSLGAVVLHEHLHRVLGVDLTSGSVADLAAYSIPAAEVIGRGALADGVYERIRDEFPRPDTTSNSKEGP